MSDNIEESADMETVNADEKINKKRSNPDDGYAVPEKPIHVKKHREGGEKISADIEGNPTSPRSTFVEMLKSCNSEHPEKDNIVELGLLFQRLKNARNACLKQYDTFISQDPANFMGMNGFEKEHGAGIDFEQLKAHAKLMMPLIVSTVEHMSKNLTTARANIVKSHKICRLMKLENPDLLSKPAYSALKKLKQPTGVDETINTVESMKMGVMCFRLNQIRPPRPEDLEAKLNQGSVDLETLLEDVTEAMNSFKHKVSLHLYFKMTLAMITFLKDLFVGVANIAKKNYLMKFGEAIDSLPTKHMCF